MFLHIKYKIKIDVGDWIKIFTSIRILNKKVRRKVIKSKKCTKKKNLFTAKCNGKMQALQ